MSVEYKKGINELIEHLKNIQWMLDNAEKIKLSKEEKAQLTEIRDRYCNEIMAFMAPLR